MIIFIVIITKYVLGISIYRISESISIQTLKFKIQNFVYSSFVATASGVAGYYPKMTTHFKDISECVPQNLNNNDIIVIHLFLDLSKTYLKLRKHKNCYF